MIMPLTVAVSMMVACADCTAANDIPTLNTAARNSIFPRCCVITSSSN